MSESPALTQFTRFSGCGAKLGPGVLEQALCGLEQPAYPELLADFSGSDGRLLATQPLSSPPLFDGMAAANGRLYLATADRHIVCLGPAGRAGQ